MIALCYITNTTYDADNFRTVNVVRYGKDDALEPDEISPWGVDSNPINDIAAAHAPSAAKDDDIILGYFIKDKKAARGETRLFATNASGVEKVRVWLHADGTIELGGTGDAGSNTKHAAQYEGLETAYNALKDKVNDLISKYNSHTHILTLSSGTGTAAPTVTTETPSTGDITGAKLEKIKTE